MSENRLVWPESRSQKLRRLCRCFENSSTKTLVASDKFRENLHSAEAFRAKSDSLGEGFLTPALVHVAVLMRWTAVFLPVR